VGGACGGAEGSGVGKFSGFGANSTLGELFGLVEVLGGFDFVAVFRSEEDERFGGFNFWLGARCTETGFG
jgi:hypothetical protein